MILTSLRHRVRQLVTDERSNNTHDSQGGQVMHQRSVRYNRSAEIDDMPEMISGLPHDC